MKALPNYAIQTICDMLIQSLLWGVALAAITGLIILSTRRQSAKLRYNLLVGALVVFTGILLFNLGQRLWASGTLTPGSGGKISQAVRLLPLVVKVNNYEAIMGLLRANANGVVLVWSLIVLIRIIQLFIGLQSLYWLRRRQVTAASAYWQDRIAQMSRRLGIDRLISLVESGIANTPMVIGHLKPLILVPTGMLTALPAEAVEAILFHELAHIYRHDYLVNLLASSLEIIFFFNPAVLWIASCIRTERENCCDDIALAHTHDHRAYVSALVACQEYRQPDIAYTMGFGAPKKMLLARAKRVLSNTNSSLNLVERTTLGLSLLGAVIFIMAFSSGHQLSGLVHQFQSPVKAVHIVDTVLNHQQNIALQPAPASKVSKTGSVNDTAKFKIYHTSQLRGRTDISFNNGGVQTQSVQADSTLYQINTRTNNVISVKVNSQTVTGKNVHYISRAGQANISTQNYKNAYENDSAQYDVRSNLYKAQAAANYQKKKWVKKWENTPPPDALLKSLADLSSLSSPEVQQTKNMISDLLKDGIITSANGLSFKVGSNGFIVNYQQQPDKIFQKYRDKYVATQQNGEWDWYYDYDSDKPVKQVIN